MKLNLQIAGLSVYATKNGIKIGSKGKVQPAADVFASLDTETAKLLKSELEANGFTEHAAHGPADELPEPPAEIILETPATVLPVMIAGFAVTVMDAGISIGEGGPMPVETALAILRKSDARQLRKALYAAGFKRFAAAKRYRVAPEMVATVELTKAA